MPYSVKGKCVYKKDTGAKVGCTKGDVDKYLGALHANVDESIIENKLFGKTIYRIPNQDELNDINLANLSAEELVNGLSYSIVGRGIYDNKNISNIKDAINMLINTNPNNEEYKKALNIANELKPRFNLKQENTPLKSSEVYESTKNLIQRLIREKLQ